MNKIRLNKVLVYATFVFLITLLVVQMIWTSHAALLEEGLFNNRVEMAIVSAKSELESDTVVSENMRGCMMMAAITEQVRKAKLAKVDELLRAKLKRYNISLEYEFDLINNKEAERLKSEFLSSRCYITHMENILVEKGIQLKLKFPSRDHFLLSQIFGMFLISALLIIAISISFVFMLRLYVREKRLAESTKDFVNNMTHELKTPLANIGLANSLISKQTAYLENPKLNKYLQIIEAEKSKMHRLAEEILTIAVIENGQICQSFALIDVHKIILLAYETNNMRAIEAFGQIELDLQAFEVNIKGEASRMLNVITNLIDNGLKYNEKEPHIKISTRNFETDLVICISDNGIGIEAKDLKCIFDKYFRVSTGNLHNAKGFGLGLTFVKMVIQDFKGSVSISSKPKEGTEVEIRLPIA